MGSAFRTACRARQTGAGIVEVMVGVLIGLIVVLVVYNLLAASESYKRMVSGVADSQITGLFSQFVLNREAGNAGSGIYLHDTADILMECPVPAGPHVDPALPQYQFRPVPMLISDSGDNDVSDSFITLYSGAPRVIWPVNFWTDTPPGAPFKVQSPNGFQVDDRVIAVNRDPTSPPATPYCGLYRVTGTAFVDVAEPSIVTLSYVPIPPSVNNDFKAADQLTRARLINLGPPNLATRTRYDVVNGQLRSTDLLTPGAQPNPIAQNVVLMKVQYGIDTSPTLDQTIDCWSPADAANVCALGAPGNDLSWQNVVTAVDRPTLNRIIAVRVGIVVRSDEPDFKDPTLTAATRPQEVLFNCSANTNAGCPGRIVLSMGAGAPNVIQDGWRYRTYETVIPMRNAIFNASK